MTNRLHNESINSVGRGVFDKFLRNLRLRTYKVCVVLMSIARRVLVRCIALSPSAIGAP